MASIKYSGGHCYSLLNFVACAYLVLLIALLW